MGTSLAGRLRPMRLLDFIGKHVPLLLLVEVIGARFGIQTGGGQGICLGGHLAAFCHPCSVVRSKEFSRCKPDCHGCPPYLSLDLSSTSKPCGCEFTRILRSFPYERSEISVTVRKC